MYVTFFVLCLYFYKDKKTRPLFAFILFLFTSPSVKIFGLYDYSLLNLNLNRYSIIALTPFVAYLFIKEQSTVKKIFSVIKIPALIIITGLIFSLSSLYIFNIENIFLYNLSFQYSIFLILLIFVSYFYLQYGFE
ncbi:MAG TPA: hypothetical protein DEP28_04530, partial [Bacteroidetes bacterium]|nr:hypothetical protein [Bacteroidota bacterium]